MSSGVGAPIINPKEGITERLAATNFQVGQDDSFISNSMRSVFKNDYPAYHHYGRDAEAERPMLAEVMTRDESFFKGKSSETVHAFDYKYLPKQELKDVYKKLRSTNFKMDVDHTKVNAFETMHSMYYPPKSNPDFNHGAPPPNIRESHIPQGDKEKEPQPQSDYRDKYRGHDTAVHRIEKAPSMHEGGPPTIKGDGRYTHFNTTHNDTFPGHLQDPVQTLPAPVGTNVPNGDPCKVATKETTMQSSFPDVSSQNQTAPYLKSEVSSKLGRTNFKQADGHSKYNDYQSTATISYKPSTVPIDRYRPGKHRNHSDLPEGDLDGARAGERVNMTSNRFYLGNPALGLHNTIISGANLRTKSNVWFGEPRMSKTFYEPTTDNTFKYTRVPYTYNRTKYYKDSDVPMNYYNKNEINHTSTWTDYRNPNRGKTVPNPVAVNNLRMSHILPPLSGPQKHNTTHQVTFTPKEAEKYSYDAGRLQKSSVPIGTMTMA